jgi:hypothetical protein
MSKQNRMLLNQYLEAHHYISQPLYTSVLCALELRETGLSASQANSMAYGKFLLQTEKVVNDELYQQLSHLTGKIWRQRGRPNQKKNIQEKKAIGNCPKCGGAIYLYPKTAACQYHTRERTSCPYVLFRTMGSNYLSDQAMKAIIKDGYYGPIENLKRNDGQRFSAFIKISHDSERPQLKYASTLKEAQCND